MTGAREAADTAPRDLSTKIVKAYHVRDEDAFVRNLISLVAAAERADTLAEVLRFVPLDDWQEQANDDTLDLIDADVMDEFLARIRAALAAAGAADSTDVTVTGLQPVPPAGAGPSDVGDLYRGTFEHRDGVTEETG